MRKVTKIPKIEKQEKADKRNYPPFSTWLWQTYTTGENVLLDTFLKNNKDDEFFFIGTDSKTVGKITAFTSAIVAYKRHVGGKILIHKEKAPCVDSMRQRLVIEAMRSLECAWYVTEKVNKDSVITIHLDVNSNLKFESSTCKEELVGMIVSQGFTVSPKPVSWAATTVAHNRCKL